MVDLPPNIGWQVAGEGPRFSAFPRLASRLVHSLKTDYLAPVDLHCAADIAYTAYLATQAAIAVLHQAPDMLTRLVNLGCALFHVSPLQHLVDRGHKDLLCPVQEAARCHAPVRLRRHLFPLGVVGQVILDLTLQVRRAVVRCHAVAEHLI